MRIIYESSAGFGEWWMIKLVSQMKIVRCNLYLTGANSKRFSIHTWSVVLWKSFCQSKFNLTLSFSSESWWLSTCREPCRRDWKLNSHWMGCSWRCWCARGDVNKSRIEYIKFSGRQSDRNSSPIRKHCVVRQKFSAFSAIILLDIHRQQWAAPH